MSSRKVTQCVRLPNSEQVSWVNSCRVICGWERPTRGKQEVLVCECRCDEHAKVPELGGTMTRVVAPELGKQHGELNERVQG